MFVSYILCSCVAAQYFLGCKRPSGTTPFPIAVANSYVNPANFSKILLNRHVKVLGSMQNRWAPNLLLVPSARISKRLTSTQKTIKKIMNKDKPMVNPVVKFVLERDFGVVWMFGVVRCSGVSGSSGVWMDFGFSFDAVPTIDTVLYFGVSELSEVNKDEIEIDR